MILLDGYTLTSKQLLTLSYSEEKIGITPEILEKIKKSNEFLNSANSRYNIYGVNTGLGPMAQFSVSDEKLIDLQYNLIRSHHTGYPVYLGLPECKSVFIARLNTLVRGHSAVSDALIRHMIQMYNEGVVPCVPLHGGVGASGDLVQLAHIAAVIIGEGMSYADGQRLPTSEAFSKKGLQGIKLALREGLALINGRSAMTGVAALNISFAKTALEWMLILSVMINEVMEAFDDHFSSEMNDTKRHKGQQEIASLARQILDGSKLMRSRNDHWDKNKSEDYFKEKVQEYYSMRCIPQILGPVYDTLAFSGKIIEDELNSTNDNPIIDYKTKNIYHGGNFHGDYISLEMDKLKLVMTRLSMLSERQLNYLLNSQLNGKLPPFINLSVLGLNFGLQGMQFTATSTTSENQTLSASSYTHSIPCNNDNQDIVSMGFNAACIASRIIDNTFEVIAIEAVAVLQAVDALKLYDQLSPFNKKIYEELRNIFPVITSDRETSQEQETLRIFLKHNGKELMNLWE